VRTSTKLLLGGLFTAVLLYIYSRTTRGQQQVADVTAELAVGVALAGNYLVSHGYTDNNPGNIRYISVNPWDGQISNHGGYGVYESKQKGTRALGKQILAHFTRRGANTVAALITIWAPSNENDTEAYIKHVSDLLDVDRNEVIDIPSRLSEVARAIAIHENGYESSDYNWQWVYL
jgi:hypothetical protein